MNCPHGRKPFVCGDCHAKPPPELLRFITLHAEAKMHWLLASQGSAQGSRERAVALDCLKRSNEAVRAHLATMGGLEALPERLMVSVRVCELGLERLPR